MLMTLKLTLASFLFAVPAFAAFDLGASAGSTPYDPYLHPVKQVLGSLQGSHASLDRVKELMRTGRSFRYSFTEPYTAQLPAVTARTRTGDCKAKSLWLADQLGDRNVRYVIGKATRTSKISHAWLMWNDGSRWWVLDPTNTSRPIAAESTSKNDYIPLYSYDTARSYRHAGLGGAVAGVATKDSSVAAKKTSR